MKKIKYLVILFFILLSCQDFELLEHSNPLEDGRPFVSTIKSDFITSTTAELYSEVISTGTTPITSFGHCWSTSNTPTIENISQENENYSNNKYKTNITDLDPLTKYYFRAFTKNSIGIAYGDELSFVTDTAGEPSVITEGVINITSTSANLFGQIEDIGNAPVTEHGHCWSTSSSPTINDEKTSLGPIGVSSFNSNTSNLTQNTTYFYRAYATNSFSTVYGVSLSFSTNNGAPTVVTIGSSNISNSSVTLESDITSIGEAPITEHGHCWSLNSGPTLSDDKVLLGPGTLGSFISNISNLNNNTTYYFRAYATNIFGTVFGNEIILSTTNGEPTVVTIGSSNVSASSVDFEGEITSSGDATVTQHGHCWSTNPNPTIGDPYTTNGNASTGFYISNTNLLSQATTYYFRAYATNSFGTAYGNVLSFTTNFGPCNITGVNSSNTTYDLTLLPSSNTFNFGDNITVNMYHPIYSAGQSSILLYENEVLIMNLCSYCYFTDVGSGNYQRNITIPSSGAIGPSNCYTIRVLGTSGNDPYLNISDPITIY